MLVWDLCLTAALKCKCKLFIGLVAMNTFEAYVEESISLYRLSMEDQPTQEQLICHMLHTYSTAIAFYVRI